jgi:hypothetical protein
LVLSMEAYLECIRPHGGCQTSERLVNATKLR